MPHIKGPFVSLPFVAAREAGVWLRGSQLMLARAGWLVLAALAAALYLLSLPAQYDKLFHFSAPAVLHPIAVPPGLAQLGLTSNTFAVLMLAPRLVFTAVYFGIGLLLFWRKSDEWPALLGSLALVGFGAVSPGTLESLGVAHPEIALLTGAFSGLGYSFFFTFFFLLFPDGRF